MQKVVVYCLSLIHIFGMSFRGINTTVIQIRRQVFTEVARLAYANVKGEKANHLMRKIPYTIIPDMCIRDRM